MAKAAIGKALLAKDKVSAAAKKKAAKRFSPAELLKLEAQANVLANQAIRETTH